MSQDGKGELYQRFITRVIWFNRSDAVEIPNASRGFPLHLEFLWFVVDLIDNRAKGHVVFRLDSHCDRRRLLIDVAAKLGPLLHAVRLGWDDVEDWLTVEFDREPSREFSYTATMYMSTLLLRLGFATGEFHVGRVKQTKPHGGVWIDHSKHIFAKVSAAISGRRHNEVQIFKDPQAKALSPASERGGQWIFPLSCPISSKGGIAGNDAIVVARPYRTKNAWFYQRDEENLVTVEHMQGVYRLEYFRMAQPFEYENLELYPAI